MHYDITSFMCSMCLCGKPLILLCKSTIHLYPKWQNSLCILNAYVSKLYALSSYVVQKKLCALWVYLVILQSLSLLPPTIHHLPDPIWNNNHTSNQIRVISNDPPKQSSQERQPFWNVITKKSTKNDLRNPRSTRSRTESRDHMHHLSSTKHEDVIS